MKINDVIFDNVKIVKPLNTDRFYEIKKNNHQNKINTEIEVDVKFCIPEFDNPEDVPKLVEDVGFLLFINNNFNTVATTPLSYTFFHTKHNRSFTVTKKGKFGNKKYPNEFEVFKYTGKFIKKLKDKSYE